jgi:methionyl-tRNA formyltransferase
MNAQYDQGDILAQRRVPVPPEVTAGRLARLLDRPSLALLGEAVSAIERGEARAAAQDPRGATDAPRPTDDDCEIVWDQPVDAVLRRIRAAAPEPGAFTGFGDDTVVIGRARRATARLRGLDAGDVVRTSEGVVVACRDGAIVVQEAQREGDGRRLVGDAVAALFPGIAVIG